MNCTVQISEPNACTAAELREFAGLVRQGFDGSDGSLDRRLRDAASLAFCYTATGNLAAIAALKTPDERYRDDVFRMADARVSPANFRLELGWVVVVPAHRRDRIAGSLCRRLLARVPDSSVFATTRPNNTPMVRILLSLGFARAGKPYPRRQEELALFLRP